MSTYRTFKLQRDGLDLRSCRVGPKSPFPSMGIICLASFLLRVPPRPTEATYWTGLMFTERPDAPRTEFDHDAKVLLVQTDPFGTPRADRMTADNHETEWVSVDMSELVENYRAFLRPTDGHGKSRKSRAARPTWYLGDHEPAFHRTTQRAFQSHKALCDMVDRLLIGSIFKRSSEADCAHPVESLPAHILETLRPRGTGRKWSYKASSRIAALNAAARASQTPYRTPKRVREDSDVIDVDGVSPSRDSSGEYLPKCGLLGEHASPRDPANRWGAGGMSPSDGEEELPPAQAADDHRRPTREVRHQASEPENQVSASADDAGAGRGEPRVEDAARRSAHSEGGGSGAAPGAGDGEAGGAPGSPAAAPSGGAAPAASSGHMSRLLAMCRQHIAEQTEKIRPLKETCDVMQAELESAQARFDAAQAKLQVELDELLQLRATERFIETGQGAKRARR
ncbi:unnamed protein product [Pedinophyceae sp. YPF-701]|nr:unnamed protein product [Pedinophyceae sp. YPF-701]